MQHIDNQILAAVCNHQMKCDSKTQASMLQIQAVSSKTNEVATDIGDVQWDCSEIRRRVQLQ